MFVARCCCNLLLALLTLLAANNAGTIGWSRSGVVAMAAGRNTTLQLQLSAAASSPVSLVLSPPASLGVAEGNRVTVQPGAMSASVTLYPRVANAAAAAVTAQPATSNDPVRLV